MHDCSLEPHAGKQVRLGNPSHGSRYGNEMVEAELNPSKSEILWLNCRRGYTGLGC